MGGSTGLVLEPGRTVMWCIEGELDLVLDVFFSGLLTGRSGSARKKNDI